VTFNTTGFDFRNISIPASSYCIISISNAYGMEVTSTLNESIKLGTTILEILGDLALEELPSAAANAAKFLF
jgi:hypothetical protein